VRVGLIGPVPPEIGGATPGGVATHQMHLAESLAAAGLDVRLLATNSTNTLAATSTGWQSGTAPLTLYRMCRPTPSLQWLAAVGAAPLARYALDAVRHSTRTDGGSRRVALGHVLWYRRFLATARPELVHVQHPMERQSYVRQIFRIDRCRLPLVVTLHSFFGEHPAATIHDVMTPNLQRADRFIAVSPHIADQAVELGADPARVTVIPSGVDVERFAPRDRLAARRALRSQHALDDPAAPLVLFVGNLEPRKGVDRLLAALAMVRQKLPDARLVVVGTGESAGADDQTPLLKGLVRDYGLTSAVDFLGRVSADVLEQWYAAADVFALPSSSEAQGIAALEAMASGLPVVASAVGGLLRTIDDTRTGFLVPAGDVARLAARLTELLDNAELRRVMGSQARAAVERDFSWRRAAEATIAVYREALAA